MKTKATTYVFAYGHWWYND